MEGLLLISYFNALRAQGLPLQEAIIQGSLKRVRPVMITALTAILGLLPAAVSTKIGAQTAQPLAIVVVGGMTVTLFLDRYLMPVLYSSTATASRRPARGAWPTRAAFVEIVPPDGAGPPLIDGGSGGSVRRCDLAANGTPLHGTSGSDAGDWVGRDEERCASRRG
jgi:hypothetical protein